jgi:hypothetical protein
MTPATAMGHMSKEMQVTYDLEDEVVTPGGTREKIHLFYAVVIYQGPLYTGLTGIFPMISSKGKWYVMAVYSFDCNYIKPMAMKSKSSSEWLKAFGGIFQELTSRGFKLKLQTMENEASPGPAMHHYRCQNVYITSTASERIVDTLDFPLTSLRCHKSPPWTGS